MRMTPSIIDDVIVWLSIQLIAYAIFDGLEMFNYARCALVAIFCSFGLLLTYKNKWRE